MPQIISSYHDPINCFTAAYFYIAVHVVNACGRSTSSDHWKKQVNSAMFAVSYSVL